MASGLAGRVLPGAKGLTVKHCRFENVGADVWTNDSGSSNCYIADNLFIGRDDPDYVIGWSGSIWELFNGVADQTFPPAMASYVAVKVYGPGHAVAYNEVANLHDNPCESDLGLRNIGVMRNLMSSSNVQLRNNLMLGEQSTPALFSVNTLTNYSSSDHNGFRQNPGMAYSFAWNAPPADRLADFTSLTATAAQGGRDE